MREMNRNKVDHHMSAFETISGYQGELTAIRRDFHEHPEIGMEEVRTADIVAKLLTSWGIEVHRGVGKTGVIGVLKRGEGKRIGLRADMDCLPMEEQTNLPYRSKTAGKMHACGHDGHTTMLLGAARYLAQSKDFKGTVNFIFQPGEEGMGVPLQCSRTGCLNVFHVTKSTHCTIARTCPSASSPFARDRLLRVVRSLTSG